LAEKRSSRRRENKSWKEYREASGYLHCDQNAGIFMKAEQTLEEIRGGKHQKILV